MLSFLGTQIECLKLKQFQISKNWTSEWMLMINTRAIKDGINWTRITSLYVHSFVCFYLDLLLNLELFIDQKFSANIWFSRKTHMHRIKSISWDTFICVIILVYLLITFYYYCFLIFSFLFARIKWIQIIRIDLCKFIKTDVVCHKNIKRVLKKIEKIKKHKEAEGEE